MAFGGYRFAAGMFAGSGGSNTPTAPGHGYISDRPATGGYIADTGTDGGMIEDRAATSGFLRDKRGDE